MNKPLLTRFEATRIVSLRSLQISDGASPLIHVADEPLQQNTLFIATRELCDGLIDAQIMRGAETFNVRDASLPPCLAIFLDTHDRRRAN